MRTLTKPGIYLSFIANLLIIFGFWLAGSSQLLWTGTSDILLAFGRLTGLLAVYFILLQFLLIGRAVWMEKTFGLDKLAHVHRLNGYLSILFILLHPILLVFSTEIVNKRGFFTELTDYLISSDDLLQAGIAVVLFVAVVFSSIYVARKHLKYETWYFVHLLTYLAVLLAFGHQLEFGGDFLSNRYFTVYWYLAYLFVFGNFIYARFLLPLYRLKKYSFTVDELVPENSGATSVFIKGKNLATWKIEAGQFINVRFLTKNFWWQSHPFSVSSLPKNDRLRITVKSLGDFTSKVQALKKGTRVLVEGPYGIFTPNPAPQTKYLFIAGGVGITPIYCLAEKIAAHNDIVILYCNKTSDDIIFKKELEELAQKQRLKLHYIMSNEENFKGEKGRIDEEKIMRLVPDASFRQAYICGPTPMMESLLKILQKIGIHKEHIHYEKFGW